ncbi:transcriptional repressor NrdR [Alkalicella caledoniensis]|uniref:Transcriptional repressor NrdR n=1 Tax=Alkalicella caledoniensis TaxID=2731377 RepID=A0A7G9WDI1_ALKCA|nr:transcriptional regulator NrdR [Alkalicella caledoniensis]QNO16743.1 transcriptional repressor NrdR [Alkalicella caledoniensis]
MKCPFCINNESKVLDSRPNDDKNAIRRRRECLKCLRRFTTYEKVEEEPILVLKKSGKKELFDKNKIIRGLSRACEKRDITYVQIENLVEGIEKQMANKLIFEISTEELGDIVLDNLKELDEVAYVRFASVYKDFKDIEAFKRELSKL